MAGEVRQHIDVASLERFINSNAPEIAIPISVKQVRRSPKSETNYELCGEK